LIIALFHDARHDLYTAVFGGDPRVAPSEGNRLVDPGIVRVYHASLAVLMEFAAHTGPILSAGFNMSTSQLITSSTTMSIKLWSYHHLHRTPGMGGTRNGIEPLGLTDTERGVEVVLSQVFQDHDRPVGVIGVSSCGKYLLGSGGCDVWIWNLACNKLALCVRSLHNFKTDLITSLIYVSPLGELTAGYDDGVIATWRCVISVAAPTAGLLPTAPNSLPNGTAANAAATSAITTAGPTRPVLVREYENHVGRVHSLELSKDRRWLFSCGIDGLICHHDALHGSRLGGIRCSSIVRAAYTGIRREYPPSLLEAITVRSPFGSRLFVFGVSGSVINIVEIQSPQWGCNTVRESVLCLRRRHVDGTDLIAALLPTNEVHILNGDTGSRARQTVVPVATSAAGSQPSNTKLAGRLRGSASTGNIMKGRARLVDSARLEDDLLSASLRSSGKTMRDKKSLGQQARNQARGATPNLMVSEWWDAKDALVLGWSDGAVEIVETTAGGRRIQSLADKSQRSAITCICVAAMPCNSKDRECASGKGSASSSTLPQRLANQAWSKNEVGSVAGNAPVSELTGPWGGPVRFKKSTKRRQANKNQKTKRLEAGFTVVAGNSQGTLTVWSPRLGRMISVQNGHSGAIVAVHFLAAAHGEDTKTLLDAAAADSAKAAAQHMRVMAIAPAPRRDSFTTASADGVVKVWTVSRAGKLIQVSFFLAQPQPGDGLGSATTARKATMTQAMVVPNSSIFICGFDNGTLQGWNLDMEAGASANTSTHELEARTPFWNKQYHSQKVTAIRASSCGRRFVTASADATIALWELTTRRGTLRSGESLGGGQLALHVVELQAFTVNLAVDDVCFVGNESALLACLGGKLFWLDGSHRSANSVSGRGAAASSPNPRDLLPSPVMSNGSAMVSATIPEHGIAAPVLTDRTSTSLASSSSSSSAPESIVGVATTDEYPFSGYQRAIIPEIAVPNHQNAQQSNRGRTISIGSNTANDQLPVFQSWALRSEDPVASIPSRYSPTAADQLSPKSMDNGALLHRTLSNTSLGLPAKFAVSDQAPLQYTYSLEKNLGNNSEMRPPSTRGSLRPFTPDTTSPPNRRVSISEYGVYVPVELVSTDGDKQRSELGVAPPRKPHPLGPQTKIAPVSGSVPDNAGVADDRGTAMIFKLLEAEFASLEPSENGMLRLADIPRLLSSMQVTTSDVMSSLLPTYPIWLVWELYQRAVRWKLDTHSSTRNAVRAPTTVNAVKRIQDKCEKMSVGKEAIQKVFKALIMYSKRHKLKGKPKTFLRREEKDSRMIVEYNSFGEKQYRKRDVVVSESLTFRQMYKDMDARDKRVRAASQDQWGDFLLPVSLGSNATKGIASIPPVHWHAVPNIASAILTDFLKRECGCSNLNEPSEFYAWPPLPEAIVRQHALQLRAFPKAEREQYVMPLYGSENVQTFPLNAVLTLTEQILREKEADDLVQDRHRHPRQGLAKFIYEWHLRTFGLPLLAGVKIAGYLRSLLEYREVPICRIIAHVLGMMGGNRVADTQFVKSGRQASSSLNLFLDARQWIQSHDVAARTSASEELVKLVDESSGYPEAALAAFDVSLVTVYRVFECVRALFPGPPSLVQRIENAVLNLPSIIVPNADPVRDRHIERGLALEAIIFEYERWVGTGTDMSGAGSGRSQQSGQNPPGSINVSVPSLGASIDGRHSNEMDAMVVSGVKQLLDDMMLADETSGESSESTRSGLLTMGTFQAALCSCRIWSSQTIPAQILENIQEEFTRDGSVAYLEFWSQLYQHVTSVSVTPLETGSDGSVILPVAILGKVHATAKSAATTPSTDDKRAYNSLVSTGGHGKSTVPVPLKTLTDRMAAMVPLFSTNLNIDSTATRPKGAKVFHNGTIEKSSSIQLSPDVSRAPERQERTDITHHSLIADHGEHSRYALRPPPKKKHPSSQKRMNMAILHQQSLNRLRYLDSSLAPSADNNATSKELVASMPTLNNSDSRDEGGQSALRVVLHPPSDSRSVPSGATDGSLLVDHMTRAVTPSIHMKSRRAIMACELIELDQREAALFALGRGRAIAHFMRVMQLLLEDAGATQIRRAAGEHTHQSSSISTEDIRRLTASISGAYKIPLNRRNAAKSVLATAATKAEAVSILIALLGGREAIEIIRASDNILRTAVCIDIDEGLRKRFLSALEGSLPIIRALRSDVKRQVANEANAARSGAQLLAAVYHLFVSAFDPASKSTSLERVDEEGALLERSLQLLTNAVLHVPRKYITENQRKAAVAAMADCSTTSEATLIFTTILEGQHSTVVFEQARSKRDQISDLADSVRTASRASSRTHLAVQESPNLRNGVGSPPSTPDAEQRTQGSSRPGSRGPSTRLYPEAYRDQPTMWESSRGYDTSETDAFKESKTNSRPLSPGVSALAEDVLPGRPEKGSVLQVPLPHVQNPVAVEDRRFNSAKDTGSSNIRADRSLAVQHIPSTKNDDDDVTDEMLRDQIEDTAIDDVDAALLAAVERADLDTAESSGRAARAAARAELEAAARTEIEDALKMEAAIAERQVAAANERKHSIRAAKVDPTAEARRLSTQFETKVREDMRLEVEAKRKADGEAKARAEAAIQAEAEAQAELQAKLQARQKADTEAKLKAEADVKLKADAEAKMKAEAESRAQANADAAQLKQIQLDVEAKVKAELKHDHKMQVDKQQDAPTYVVDTSRDVDFADHSSDSVAGDSAKAAEAARIARVEADAKFDVEYEAKMQGKVEAKVAQDMKDETARKEEAARKEAAVTATRLASDAIEQSADASVERNDSVLGAGTVEVTNNSSGTASDTADGVTLATEPRADSGEKPEKKAADAAEAALAEKVADTERAETAAAETAAALAELNALETGKSKKKKGNKKKSRKTLKAQVGSSSVTEPIMLKSNATDETDSDWTGIAKDELESDSTHAQSGLEPAGGNEFLHAESVSGDDSNSGTDPTPVPENTSSNAAPAEVEGGGVELDIDTEVSGESVSGSPDTERTGSSLLEHDNTGAEFLQHTRDLLEEQKNFMAGVRERRESETKTEARIPVSADMSHEETSDWYAQFQALCVSDEDESDGMDSGNDEFGLTAVAKMQSDAVMAAKRAHFLEAFDQVDAAKKTAREKALAEKKAELARKRADETQRELERILDERRRRQKRREERARKHTVAPLPRAMNMDGLNPEYGLSFSENIKFAPFNLMKGPTSVPPWDEYDAAEESDGPDSAEDEEEAKEWRVARNRVISAVKEGKMKNIMSGMSEDILPDNWASAPPMFKLEHSLWRPFFRHEEEELLQEVEVVEEKELDVMAKRLEDQKAALLAGELFDEKEEEERKEKKDKARGHWGKIRMHVKTKWRLSKSLRKSRMKSSSVKPLESGKPVNDIIAKGKTKDDELSSFRYFSLKVDSEHAIITVTVTSSQGDPDLYVSNHILPSTGESFNCIVRFVCIFS
jgi:WD40 repeat protein